MKTILRFNKLFEYYDYLENILDKSFEDIEKMSDLLNSHIFTEN